LREWKRAEGYYRRIATANEEAVLEIEKIKSRIAESTEGRIDYMRLFNEAIQKGPTPRLECADYVGPIKPVIDRNDYKKLVATRAIEPGTLLLCEKAFSIVSLN